MSGDEELDLSEAVPLTPAEKAVNFFKGEVETPMHPKEITEEMLATLYDNLQELDHLSKLVEMQKKDIKELAKGEESVLRGRYAAFLKPVKGRMTVDWQGYCKSQIKEIPAEELKAYTKEGEPSVRLEVKKLG